MSAALCDRCKAELQHPAPASDPTELDSAARRQALRDAYRSELAAMPGRLAKPILCDWLARKLRALLWPDFAKATGAPDVSGDRAPAHFSAPFDRWLNTGNADPAAGGAAPIGARNALAEERIRAAGWDVQDVACLWLQGRGAAWEPS